LKTLLITGVSGFIGSQAAKYFKTKGLKVVGVDQKSLPQALVDIVDRYEQIKLPDERLKELLDEEKPDFCLHCAGGASVAVSVAHPEEDFRSHVPVTYGLLNGLRLKAPDCKTIYISSAAVYGNPKSLPVKEDSTLEPISPYGYHKMNCELICRQFNYLYRLKVCSVRIFSAYGAGLSKQLLWDIFQKARISKSLKLYGTGDETRDFIHVSDIVKAFEVIFARGDFDASAYNLASGTQISIRKVAQLMLDGMNIDIPIVFNGYVRAGDPKNWEADTRRLRGLGFRPSIDFSFGVERYVNWCYEEQV
jgi:UDP-glucose 4-epimerase